MPAETLCQLKEAIRQPNSPNRRSPLNRLGLFVKLQHDKPENNEKPVSVIRFNLPDSVAMKFNIKIFLLLLTISVGCNKGQDPSGNEYTIPAEFDDGIKTASLKSVGMDDAPILEMMDHINSIRKLYS